MNREERSRIDTRAAGDRPAGDEADCLAVCGSERILPITVKASLIALLTDRCYAACQAVKEGQISRAAGGRFVVGGIMGGITHQITFVKRRGVILGLQHEQGDRIAFHCFRKRDRYQLYIVQIGLH